VLGVAGGATHAQETVFEAAASEVVLELALDILWQRCAVRGHPVGERGVVCIDELIEEGGLRSVAFIANSATSRAGILVGLSHDRFLALWWFGGRLADGCEDCLSIRYGVQSEGGTK
jgi:hypothetical protein